MKFRFPPIIFCLACLFLKVIPSFAQLTGIKSIPGDYATVSLAVTALNAAGAGTGGVTFNVAANYTETITATISLTVAGTVTNPVLFQKDPATTGANPVITAYTTGVGTPATAVQDGIWRLVGSHYVTIDGIDVKDNPANTTNPSTMEYGYALYKASTANGCQFVTIKNCVITLNNVNNATGTAPMVDGSTGIVVMNALPATATTPVIPVAGGANSNNKFYSNTIQNCNTGIGLIGYAAPSPFTLGDTNNDIGGSAVSTGNTIINFGGAGGAANPAAAIRTLAQYGLSVSYNIINNNNGSGTNHPNALRGIYINAATSASATVTFNTITLNGGGTIQTVTGIENVSGSTSAGNAINISNNTITGCTYSTATTGGFNGILNSATPATLSINANTISNNSSSATVTGFFYGINNTGAATSATISGNIFSGNSTAALTTGLFVGIYNAAASASATINANTILGNSTTAMSGAYYAIYNTGAVTTSLTINSNNIGNGTTGAFTFNSANSGTQIFLNNTAGAATAALSISNNNFQGINYAVQGTGLNTYISNSAATLSQTITGNTFTNLNVNTIGNITFIANSVVVSSNGTQNVNSNSIVGSFNKPASGGTVTLFTSGASSLAGSIINNNSNNFSNITVTGATIIAGWVNTDAGGSTKTIQNNNFSNWTGGTGAITAMSISLTGASNATTGNAITNISSAGTITGILTAAGNDNIYSNIIDTLVSSGTLLTTVNGISVTAGVTKNIYQNTINNLKGNSITTGTVRGIVVSGGTTINIYQNTIDTLQGNSITSGSVNGISISGGTNINPYQNTIYSLQGNSITTGSVNGISVSAGVTIVAHRNKIYDLSSSNSVITTGTVNGIQVSGAIASMNTTIRNNLIGDLRTPSANVLNPIIGISLISAGLTSSINVYDNTVYLNGTSSGTNFGSTGLYHVTNATATTAKLELRNNIITNISTPNGTGFTVAYRRSSATLTNYASTSNNNLFYAGASGATRLIFYDGTNPDQTLSTYKARVAPAEALSVTEDLITASKFLSTTGSSPSFLHIDPSKTTQVESGGAVIASVTNDYDGDVRQGNTGYPGTGTAPDIGADEFEGIKLSALSGTYNVGTGQAFTSLTSAGGLFAAVNALGLSGNMIVNITSDLTEDGSNSLSQWVEQGSGNYTLTIQPDTATLRTISGNVLQGMIRYTGADRVTIDGRYSESGTWLTFRNINTAGTTGTAFTFINGATNNTVEYCNIEAFANATTGVILFSTSTIAGGNSNNLISNCNVNATVSGNTGNIGIYSAGTVGNENSANTISNSNVFNYRDRGMDIAATGSKNWTINTNSFYNGGVTGSINYTATSILDGIRILGGTGYSIINNYIGGSASLATGSNASYSSTLGNVVFYGIQVTSATGTSNIKGNTIRGVTISSVPAAANSNEFVGIETIGAGIINVGGISQGDGNTIGSNTTNGSVIINTNTTAAANTSFIRGIDYTSTTGLVIGNQIGGFDISNTGSSAAVAAPSTFQGITINIAAAPTQVNSNIVGSAGTGAVSNSIRVLATSTANNTSLAGIFLSALVTSTVQVNANIIQNMSQQVTTVTSGTFTGISIGAIAGANITVVNNSIKNNSVAPTTAAFYGILSNGNLTSISISSDTISNNTSNAATTGLLYGISTSGAASAITINNNTFSGNSTALLTTGSFAGIINTATPATLNITSNTFYSNATTSVSGAFYPVFQSGAVTAAININSNNIGTATSSAITYSAANSGAQFFIDNTGGGAACVLSISNNSFQGINYSLAAGGTGANTYISNTAATFSQAINGNTFTNLNVNTAGNTTFIANSVIVSGTGTQNVNNNSISGTFTKKAGGTVTLFNSGATSVAGSVINNNSNNFSNITVTGATIIAGWVNTDAGNSTKNIQNNIFGNWVGGTSAVTALTVNISGTSNATTGNLINNISGAAAITGITTGAGNDNIYSNTINTLSTTGAAAVTAIAVTAGTTKNIYKNKIYDISGSNATSTVNGILVSGGITVNVYNNLIGDLRTPAANSATDAIRGISVTSAVASSAINVYYNTVYLNATSSGAAFGTSGIYHLTNATATTAALNLRNNCINNTSTPKGTGLTVAYRRSSTVLTNYASTSNNNLFYGGIPSTTQLIFSDATNKDQALSTYQTRVSIRDALSVTEDETSRFLSIAGSSSVFLHVNSTITTQIESGAVNITGFTDDFDGQIRAGNPGYTGTSSSPDIGADEIFGVETIPPTITYTLLTNTTSTVNRGVTGVVITDESGVNIAAGTKPRIYYKRASDANVWLDNSSSSNGWKYTEATNSTSPFTFTIDYSLLYGGATVTAGAIQYFIVAQDIATTANIAINSGTFAIAPSSAALTSAAFPIAGTINSYTIPFSGTYNIGTSEIFTSLTKANGLFASINNAGLAGNVTFNVTSDLAEDGTNALNQWTESGLGHYTVTIQPDVATGRIISGSVASGLIRLNGADRVIIDGRNGGTGSYLSFKNTNAAGTTGSAFTLINGATNDAIRYCDVEAYADATDGVILFGTTVAGGNSNNLIDNCTINATVASNTGNVAVYSGGTAGNENSSDTISNNTIYGYRDRGLDINTTGSSAWTISGNSFYNGNITATINYASSSTLHGIRISGGSGYSILNNYIGGNSSLASGNNASYTSNSGNVSYQGILLTTTSALPVSNIKGNTITAISLSSIPTSAGSAAFTGIETNGAGINIGGSAAGEGNQVGSSGNNGSIIITTSTASMANTSLIKGINCVSAGGSIIGNQVAGFDINNIGTAPSPSYFIGIYINSSAAPSQVANNIIGSSGTSNSIRVLSTSSAATTSLAGISVGGSVNSNIVLSGNTIENVSQLSLTSSGNFTGISNAATSGTCTISSDTIQNINTAANANSGSTVYSAITSGGASSITGNIINNIALISSGANAQITGINVSGAFAHTITGNVISALSTASGKTSASVETGSPASTTVIGILNTATLAGQIISGNTLYNFNATNNTAINTVVTGIGITATISGNIFNNRIAAFTNKSTGSGPGICGIAAANGSFNLYNNSVKLDNSVNANGVKIYGIIHAAGNTWNYYYNTISIGGNSTGTALRSAAFIRPVTGDLFLRNNVFINTRTGTGLNYAISNLVIPPTSTWPSTASNYNNLYSSNLNTTGEWGLSTNKTFAQWQTASGGAANSVSRPVTFIGSSYDLQPDSNSNCALSNSGTPITTPIVINTDINNAFRNSASPDMGAYEFSYTPFTVIAGNNSPVCSGDIVSLSVNPGNALNPSFSWTNPAGTVISTIQNPTVVTVAGQYKVTVTDVNGCFATDSTLISINKRPTANITSVSQTSVCDSGFINLNISVTGTGTISGILSSGDNFSGTAPLVIVPVFVTATTSYSIISLSDSSCTAIAAGIPDTVTVIVTHQGNWLGITTNWHDPVNWCGGVLPTSSTDVIIPAGTSKMPLITDSVYCNNLTINTGDTLTITTTGILDIAGVLTNNGTYKDNGTTNFNGTSGQQTFSGVTTFNNLTLSNSNGLLLPVAITVNNNLLIALGILNANNFGITLGGNWINNASITGFTAGTAIVTFNSPTAQVIGGTFATTFNNLTIANTGSTVSLNVNAAITGNLSVSAGTFDLAGFTANRTAAGGSLTVSNNTTLRIGGANTYPANYAVNTLVVASTVEYSGTNQMVANQLYGNLMLTSSGGASLKTFPATALAIAGNLISALGSGTSVSFTAGSAITVSGNVSIGVSTTFNGSSYSHTIVGNWINNGTFNGNTGTITFQGPGTAISGTGIQNFNNLTVAAPGVTFSSNSVTLTGNLATTGSGSFIQASGGTVSMTGTGTTIAGSGISIENLNVSGSVTTLISLNLTGNLAVSGNFTTSTNTITMSGASKTISGAGGIVFSQLKVTGSVTTNANFSISSSLTVNGSLSASSGTVTFNGTSTLSGTANLFSTTINGTSLQLSSGSVLGIANIFTITSGTFDVTTSGPNTVNFNGTGPQNINGIIYSNLILSNGSTKTASGSITTMYDITIGTRTIFNPSTYVHSIYGDWNNNGTFTTGTSIIQFLGPANADISGVTTFNILTINTTNSGTEITLQNNISASIVNMVNGNILTGLDTLTITNTRTGNGIIMGNIQRTHVFTTGVAYAFEGPENTVTFSAVSLVGSVTVSVTKGSINDFPFGGSISRLYNITVPTGSYTATLRLHYEDDELNGNNESTMALWHYNGSLWGSVGKTANSTTSNYVEQSALTDITNRWTVSDNSNLVQWNGSVSTDWSTAANWTVLQGSGSRPPSSSDIVDLGTAPFINQPTISNGVTVKNIIFGSAQAVTLTLGGGGSLTTLGDINGNWTSNATHTINVNNQTLIVNGNLDLSDGTNSQAINLNIGSGMVTTLGSISETGGANIKFSGAGTLNIYNDFTYSSGTFTAGSGTVTYNGTENQDIANINYNNLTINKAGGLAAINNTVNIAGNLLISGELDNFSTTTISGNVTINAGDTLNNYQVLHVQGNWNNNGIYIGTGSSIYFDGSGTQTITSTTFNNFNINKPVGSSAVLTGDILINGDLTVTSGTLDIQTSNCNRGVTGGTFALNDSATFMMASNNMPLNFSTVLLTNASTVIADGTGPQMISGNSFGHLTFRNGGVKTLATPITVNGNLTIESGSYFDASSNTITLNGNWVNNGTFSPSTGTLIFSGTSKSLTGNTTFNQAIFSGSYTALNDLTFNGLYNVTNTGSILAGSTITFTFNGDVTTNGTVTMNGTYLFTGTTLQTIRSINAVIFISTIYFNGSVAPVFNSTASPTFRFLNINNTGGISPLVGWTILNSLTIGSGASFNGGGSTHNIQGNVTNNGTITSSGILNFIPASAAVVNLGSNFSSTGRVIFGGVGAMTLAGASPLSFHNVVISNTNAAGITPSSAWNMSNNITVNGGSIFNAGNYTYLVGGKISNNGTINSATSTFILNGTGAQDIFTLSNFNNLTINKASGLSTISSNVTVNGVLNFVAGTIETDSNVVIQPSTGTVTGAAQTTGWVNGNLEKSVAAGSNVPATFEIGDAGYYTPATVLFSGVSVSGNLTASATPADHPQIDLSGINKNLDVNRYWTLTNAGIAFTTAVSTFNWVPSDVDAGATTANFKTSVYNGTAWGISKVASPLPTSIEAIGLTSLGSFVIGEGPKIATWTGAAGSADWFTAGNWFGGVPDITVETLIPGTLQAGRVFPVINTGTAIVDSITIQTAATLTLSNSTLQIKGSIINNGILDAGNGTIEMNGGIAQTISANTFLNNAINNLIVSNRSTGGLTLGGALDLYGSLTYSGTGMTLTTNDSLTLKSTALNTASVGDMTGNTITGSVTVERYISARKAWRLLSVPTNTNQSIQQSWQEGCGANLNCVVDFGTQITGPGGTTAGFDVYTATPSVKTYNSATNGWTGIANTTSGIKTISGYIIFIRGDRSAITFNSSPTQTVLRTHGNLYTGDQPPIAVSAGKFASIGNPYASTLDMRNITKTGVKNFFYVWDPNLGGSSGNGAYQTFSYNGSDYVITPGMGSYGSSGSISNYIQSGQAFLVQADSVLAGSITFKEGAKTGGSRQVSRPAGLSRPQLQANLYGVNTNNSTYMIDGALINYDDSYSNNVDDMDAVKSANTSENLAIKTANTLLVIERRHTVINEDTIFLNLTGTKVQKYRFEFTSAQLDQQGLTGFLEDNYLNTSTPINLNGRTTVDFNILKIPASYAPDRFRIVFKQLTILPVTFTSVKAYQKNEDIAVEWKVDNEINIRRYELEKSNNGSQFARLSVIEATGNNSGSASYQVMDAHPVEGYNYYRIKSVDLNGKTEYTNIVKVLMGNGKYGITIYPNPIVDGVIGIQLNNMPEGRYIVKLLNNLQQEVLSKIIQHAKGSSTDLINIDKKISHGIYQLQIIKPGNEMIVNRIMY